MTLSTATGGLALRHLSVFATTLAVLAALVVAAEPAAAAGAPHSPPWRWTTVTNPRTAVGIGQALDVVLACPSGYRPIGWVTGSSFDNAASTITVRSQTLDYTTNSGTLSVYNGTAHTDAVDATLNCVNGDDVGTITTVTSSVSHFFGSVGGFVQCALGTTMLGGSASWSALDSSRIDFMAPTSSGWYVSGYRGVAGGTLSMQVHCIDLSVASGVVLAQSISSPDPNAEGLVNGTAACQSGNRVANAGAYEHPDGETVDATKTLGALRSISQYSSLGTGSVTVKATSPNTTTTLVVQAICVPFSTPTVAVSGPSGLQASRDVTFSFSATDPAGYDLDLTCQLFRLTASGIFGIWELDRTLSPCTPGTTIAVTGIDDGLHLISVTAENPDSRSATDSTQAFEIDATGPQVSVTGPPSVTASTSASLTVTATDPHMGSVTCHLDGETDHVCPSPATYSALADGAHVFTWSAHDTLGNQRTGSYSWWVDTVKPTVSMTAPTSPFTVGSSTTVKWTGGDSGSGVASYRVQWRRAPYNGTFGTWSSPLVLSASTVSHRFTRLAAGYDYCFMVEAVDKAGNVAGASQRCTAIPLDDRSLTAGNGWKRLTGSKYYLHTATNTKLRGKELSRTGAKVRRVAIVATKCASCGVVGVYVRGVLMAKVSLYRAKTAHRQLIVLPRFSYRTGKVTLKVRTRGKTVRIDGLGISRT